jgi:hypothetical protein
LKAGIPDSFDWNATTARAKNSIMDQLIVRYDFLEATFRTVMHLINKARHEAIDFLFHRF